MVAHLRVGVEGAGRNASEPDSASLRTRKRPSSQRVGGLVPDGEAASMCSRRGFPGWLGAARADRSVKEPGISAVVGLEPNAPGNRQAAAAEVGGARSSVEAANHRGAKGPYRTHA